jgi:hypothetical protein
MSNFFGLSFVSWPCDYRNCSHNFCVSIMTYPNVHDLLVPKALNSPNMWNHMRGPPGLMIKKIYGASLKQCTLLPQFQNGLMFLGLCHCIWIFSDQSWFYLYALSKMSMIISFLPNGDSKYTYVFPPMINVGFENIS